jgi:hydroxymethylbilane synthase
VDQAVTKPAGTAESGSVLRIGTRASRLARWQSEWVAARLREAHEGLEVELVEIRTAGDRDRNSPLSVIGGSGLFTKEIQRALAEGVVDLAVHSLKDLPTAQSEGLTLGAVPARESVADALISPRYRTLEGLPASARVGTSSLRRRAQLLHIRPDLVVENLRGNVETRLKAAHSGDLDAVVLAEAGLARLGLAHEITERLVPPRFFPAVGQGALGVECRAADAATRGRLAVLNDASSRAEVVAERSLLAELEGGCVVPIAAWARLTPAGLALDGVVLCEDGKERLHAWGLGLVEDPAALGRSVAANLMSRGAWRLLGRS